MLGNAHNDNINNYFFQAFGRVCLMGVRTVICLSLFTCLFIYLFLKGVSFWVFLPLCFYCHKLLFHIFGDTFLCRIDVHLGPQITLKISAWMVKNLKALKRNISLTEALIIVGFSPLS